MSLDARRAPCASAAAVWGSQHVLSPGTCTPTVLCPLGWPVACTTRQGQRVRPTAPSGAPDRRPRLVPVRPLAGGCCVRGGRLHRGEAPHGLRTLQRVAGATLLTPLSGHLHRGPSRYSRGSDPSRKTPPGGR